MLTRYGREDERERQRRASMYGIVGGHGSLPIFGGHGSSMDPFNTTYRRHMARNPKATWAPPDDYASPMGSSHLMSIGGRRDFGLDPYNSFDPLHRMSPGLGGGILPNLGPNRRRASYSYPYDDYWGDYDLFSRHQGRHRHLDQNRHGSCPCGDSACAAHFQWRSIPNNKSLPDLETKDVVIRGVSYRMRKTFLTESAKFESDLVKYMEKKKEEQIPTSVIHLLIDFINMEGTDPASMIDLVTLHTLASNLGSKSVMEYALSQIKKMEGSRLDDKELAEILLSILMSPKADDSLKEWLKKYLAKDDMAVANRIHMTSIWRKMVDENPELEDRLHYPIPSPPAGRRPPRRSGRSSRVPRKRYCSKLTSSGARTLYLKPKLSPKPPSTTKPNSPTTSREYYAAATGPVPGVYTDPLNCEKEISSFGILIVHTFATMYEAQWFLGSAKIPETP
ncbi:hypothetical protein B7494_g1041 [Chlorociboria aeruginascens]|nr:hypothetical protein B7494_g1041 [Chlorociboria aeruginascens]